MALSFTAKINGIGKHWRYWRRWRGRRRSRYANMSPASFNVTVIRFITRQKAGRMTGIGSRLAAVNASSGYHHWQKVNAVRRRVSANVTPGCHRSFTSLPRRHVLLFARQVMPSIGMAASSYEITIVGRRQKAGIRAHALLNMATITREWQKKYHAYVNLS